LLFQRAVALGIDTSRIPEAAWNEIVAYSIGGARRIAELDDPRYRNVELIWFVSYRRRPFRSHGSCGLKAEIIGAALDAFSRSMASSQRTIERPISADPLGFDQCDPEEFN
jgi:hypothetical protein